jgi:hypothetical protein
MWLYYCIFQPLLNSFSPSRVFFQKITIIICGDDYTTTFSSILDYEPTTGTQTLCSTTQVQVPLLYKDIMLLYMTTVSLVSSHHLYLGVKIGVFLLTCVHNYINNETLFLIRNSIIVVIRSYLNTINSTAGIAT